MNDISHQLCTEEEIIYEIVDDIIITENKITEMTNSLIINNDSNLNQPQFNLKHKISKNISEINSLNSDLKNKKNDLKLLQKANQKEINNIEMHIQEIEMKIKNISNINNIKEDIYKISYEKIEEIIHKKKNEDDLKQTFYEYSNYNSQLQNLKINLTSLQMQYNQIQERLQLLNEEINSTEDNIINLLSQKESIEELCNLLFKINTSHKNNQNILNTNNNVLFSTMSKYNITTTLANQSELRNIELFHYEICQCDIAKISKDISEIILNYINTSLNTTTIQTNTNNILMYEDNNEMINMYASLNDNIELNNNNNVKINTKNPLLKNQLISLIRTSITSFINSKSKLITSYKVSAHLSNLSNKIITLFPKSNLTQTKVCDLLKYMFKIAYFDNIIKQEMTFMDKDNKLTKKHLLKRSDELNMQIQKIKNRIDDYVNKIASLKQKEKFLTQNKTGENVYLSPEEKEYLELKDKLNELKTNKNTLLKQNDFKEENIKNEITSIQKHINDLILKNKTNEIQLDQLNQEFQKQKGNINDQIISLRKDIAEKFKLIKMQLAIFKQKHGNMDLYNKLTERINQTLKSTSKNLFNLNCISTNNNSNVTPTSTLNQSVNRNFNNSFLLNNSLNANENESTSNINNPSGNNNSNNMDFLLLSASSSTNTNKQGSKQYYNVSSSNSKNNRQHHSSNSSGPHQSNYHINSINLSQSTSMSRLHHTNKSVSNNNNNNYNFVNLFDNNNTNQSNNNSNNNVNNTYKNNNLSNIHLLHNKNQNNGTTTNYFNRTFKQHISQPIVLKSRNFENLNSNACKQNNKINNPVRNIGFNYEQVNKGSAAQKLQNNKGNNNNISNNNKNSSEKINNNSRSNNALNHSNSSNILLRHPHGVFHPNIKQNIIIKEIKTGNNTNGTTNFRKLFSRTKAKW